ncbi:octanoyltransferase [Hahella sp. CCB-MM4]|uniref:lipoyl(octanoyl) transferase LipB n=1 Tax=Hahella sp. (strain CCB-MM4) TaxID=1926491 RepID=UPI000B9B9693|nr:lipoyl(octanoyl) transferase LipB [Hahella sp. CCB-MM4]OZG71946.1 octanoyltransferase [Hahella sp. CCB-MM4]
MSEIEIAPPQDVIVRQFGVMPYEPVWKAMQAFTQDRDDDTLDEIWLLQHERVFTQGQAGKAEHVLMPGDIPVVKVDRGGQVTYHGPGQLMAYLLLRLPRLKIGVRELVTAIEETTVETLAGYGIKAYPKPDAPGVYVDEAKIASLGLRIRRGSSFHGLALNINMDLEPFLRINPCGYAGLQMTQVSDLNPAATLPDVAARWLEIMSMRLGYRNIIEKRGLPEYE